MYVAVRHIAIVHVILVMMLSGTVHGQEFTSPGPVSLSEALRLVIDSHPSARLAEHVNAGHQSTIDQASAFMNPELEIFTSNFGTRELEVTISQTFERGGKRRYRVQSAENERNLAVLDLETHRRELILEVIRRYFDVLETQLGLELQERLVTLTHDVAAAVQKRVDIGATSAVELERAQTVSTLAGIERDVLLHEFTMRKELLAALWSGSGEQIAGVVSESDREFSLPPQEEFIERLPEILDMKIADHIISGSKLEILAAEAAAKPDISLGVGYVFERADEDEHAATVMVRVPLHVLDKNSGAINAAQSRLKYHETQRRVAEMQARTIIVELYSNCERLLLELSALDEKALPRARSTLEQIEELYRIGRMSMLDLLDAQSTLIEMERARIEKQMTFRRMKAELAHITGNLQLLPNG